MIIVDHHTGLITLHTRHTTYQMKADQHGVLLHTYYGSRIRGDLSRLIPYADRGFSPNPDEADRTYSLDVLPQEYSGSGNGDYRLSSLALELPDGSCGADFRYTDCITFHDKYKLDGLPAFFGSSDEAETLLITLEDRAAQISVQLMYGVFEAYDLITRAVRVVNHGDRAIRIRQAASLCLDLPSADLDLITFDGRHTYERVPHRAPLRPGVQSVGSVRGMSSHQHNPFAVLCAPDAGEDHGLCYGAMLLYSGNFQAAVERNQFDTARLTLGIHPDGFTWDLAPGEAFTTPEAALVCSPDGFGPMSRSFHRAIRDCLIRDPWADRPKPVLVNSWETTYFDFDDTKLLNLAKESAALGVELFVLDDGWFGHRNDDRGGLGDWWTNESKLPGGLAPFSKKLKDLGMSLGLWIEPECVSEDSALYAAHPDWVLHPPGRPYVRGRDQLVLDFTRKEVRDAVFGMLRKALDGVDLAYLKWDMNRCLTAPWSAALPPERQGEVPHRYVLGVYELLERFRKTWPDVLIEGCAGGGGRFDAGMLYYTPQIWCSDNTDAIDRLTIQYGTSFAYPPCTMGAHVASVPSCHTDRWASLAVRGTAAMSGAFGYELDLGALSPEEKAEVAQQVAEYKATEHLIRNGDYYRLSRPDGPYTAWANVSRDQREALVSLVAGPAVASPPFLFLKLQGLNPALQYRVNGEPELWPGDMLMQAGYPLPLLREHTAIRLHLRAE